jgi:hypothetical protein
MVISNMERRHYVRMFDEQEFVLVCRKNDYGKGCLTGDNVFLVSRDEWENGCDWGNLEDCECWEDYYPYKTFDLLLVRINKNVVSLPNFRECPNAVCILKRLPFSAKIDYMVVPKE